MPQPPPAMHMEGSPAATSGGPGGMVSLSFVQLHLIRFIPVAICLVASPANHTPIPFIAIAFPRAQKTCTPAGPISGVSMETADGSLAG